MPRLDLNPENAAALDRLLDEALDLEPWSAKHGSLACR